MGNQFVGNRIYRDMQTGEDLEMPTFVKTAGDAGFHKVWLNEILDLVDEVGNQKMKVLMWLLSHADSQNRIFASWHEISEGTGVGRTTISALLGKLKEADVIIRVRPSVWRLNPDVIFKGDHKQRMGIVHIYKREGQGDLFEPTTTPEEDAKPKQRGHMRVAA